MQSAFIINDRTGKPYAVVGILPGGTEFYPIAESAVSWASWMTEDFAAKKITKEQLTVTLDNSMTVEGPMPANRANKPKLDELIKKAKRVPKGESDKEEMEQAEEKSLVPVISIMDARLDNLENTDWRNTVNFKAKSFLMDTNKSTFAYEIKRTRAVWDASLSIPGTERRGGFRCPPGTRYGGQITDRFGRNCGWGVARRLANEIADLGERVENVDDRRRERRVNRRNERVARRLREGGRVERAARAIGDALETGTPGERKPGLLERAAGRVAEALDSPSTPRRPGRQRQGENRRRPGVIERAAGRIAEALESDGTQNRPAPRRPRPQAPQARPARPRQQRRPRPQAPEARPNNRRPQPTVDNTSGTPVPAGAPRVNETLEQYKTRKYNEHQQRVREIQNAGGRAGFLTREEWEQFHGPTVEENWNRAQQRNGGRAARRTATDAAAGRTATRRPTPADEPDAVQPARRQRIPFRRYQNQRALNSEAAAWRRVDAIDADMNNLQMRQLSVIEYNGKFYIVNEPDKQAAIDAGGRVVPRPQRNTPPAPRRPRPQPAQPANQAQNGGRRRLATVTPLNKAEDRHDTAMPRLANDDGSVRTVAIGNSGINTKEDAAAFNGPLSEVPDAFLKDALDARSANLNQIKALTQMDDREGLAFFTRLQAARTNPSALSTSDKEKLKQVRESGIGFALVRGSSITAPSFYLRIREDGSIDGRGYLLKPEDPGAKGRGQHSELIGIELAERLGFAHGAPRLIPSNQGVVILAELGPNFARGHARDFGIQDPNQNLGGASQLGHAVVNALLGAADRHGRNGMNFQGNGALPIDFGRGFVSMKSDQSADKMVRYMRNSLARLDNDFMKGYKNDLEQLVSSGIARAEAVEQIHERIRENMRTWKVAAQAMIDDGSYDRLTALIPNPQSGDIDYQPVRSRKNVLQARINLLDSDELLSALTGLIR